MKKHLLSMLTVMLISMTVIATVPERKGWWKFDNAADLLAATIGSPLTLTGSQESVAGPETGNLATLIGLESYLTMAHGIGANGGGTLVNEYSLQFDVSIPEGLLWHALYQTTPDNSDDAEMFINTDNYLGAWRCGYSTNAIEPGTWYRIIVSVKNPEFFRIYVDGILWVEGTPQPLDDRDALQSLLLIFADNDGEDNPIKCSELGIWEVALSAEEALELGDAFEGGQPTVPERKGYWKFDDPLDLLKAEIGVPLALTGTQASVPGPGTNNLATQIGVGSYLSMTHGIAPNGGGEYVNEFSLQIDFSVPEIGVWHAFIQTNPDNSNDADLFTNTSNAIGVGDVGYSENTISANTWYRMILSIKNDQFFKIYINGELWLDGAGQPLDGRYGIEPVLVMFGDNDGEDATIICSELAIWDVALTAEEAELLGNPETGTGIGDPKKFLQTSDLGQNYPNPFSSFTTFPYKVIQTGRVYFSLLDFTGRQMSTFDDGIRTPGTYRFEMNSEDLPNGLYYLRMTVNDRVSTCKIMVVK
jgi:hypothetical protein